MPFVSADLTATAYQVIPFSQIVPAAIGNSGLHLAIANAARVNFARNVLAGQVSAITFTGNALGNAIYLPYLQDKITSVVLPKAGPPDYFFTDNMSGCSLFIEDNGANLIVAHANAVQHSPNKQQSESQPLYQNPLAAPYLNGLHAQLRTDYAGAALGGTLVAFHKAAYMAGVATEVSRKQGQGRTVRLTAGTTIIGFRTGTVPHGWEFWCQTWGALEYDRPWYAIKAIATMGKTHRPPVAEMGNYAAPVRIL